MKEPKISVIIGAYNCGSFIRETIDSVINQTYGDWEQGGELDSAQAAAAEVAKILAKGNPAPLPDDVAGELDEIVGADAARLELGPLPVP